MRYATALSALLLACCQASAQAQDNLSEKERTAIYGDWYFQDARAKEFENESPESVKQRLAQQYDMDVEQLNAVIRQVQRQHRNEREEEAKQQRFRWTVVILLAAVNLPVYVIIGWALNVHRAMLTELHSSSWRGSYRQYTLGYQFAAGRLVLFLAGCVTVVAVEYMLVMKILS